MHGQHVVVNLIDADELIALDLHQKVTHEHKTIQAIPTVSLEETLFPHEPLDFPYSVSTLPNILNR